MLRIVYLLPVLLLAWLGGPLFKGAYNAYSSRSWPTTEGEIVRSGVERFGGKGCHFGLNLQYAYVVDGAHYLGQNYRFGGECDDSVIAIAAAHPVGTHVLVHYKPEHPEQSVISPGDLSGNSKVGLVGLPFFMLLGVSMFFLLRRERASKI